MSDIWLNKGTYGSIGCSRWSLCLNNIIWYSGLLMSNLKNHIRFWNLVHIGLSLLILFCFQTPITIATTWCVFVIIGGKASNWWTKTWIKDRYISRTSWNRYATDILKRQNIGCFIVFQMKIIETCQFSLLRSFTVSILYINSSYFILHTIAPWFFFWDPRESLLKKSMKDHFRISIEKASSFCDWQHE